MNRDDAYEKSFKTGDRRTSVNYLTHMKNTDM